MVNSGSSFSSGCNLVGMLCVEKPSSYLFDNEQPPVTDLVSFLFLLLLLISLIVTIIVVITIIIVIIYFFYYYC